MSSQSLRLPVNTSRAMGRSALLQGVSLGALMVAASGVALPARASPFRSLNQALALSGRAAAQSALAPSVAVTASQQAARGAQSVTQAANRFRSLADALAGASSASGASPIVVDGVGPGAGLQVAPGAQAGGSLWQGAALPTATTTPAGTTVTVTQTTPLAQLTWQTFNVGRKTTLNFNQSAGGTLASSWVVINTVQDPQESPTRILGDIRAQGKVYVLDRNGIAFGVGSTVNVGSLIAATADIAASQFATTASGVTSFSLYGAQTSIVDPVTGVTSYYQPSFINGTSNAITVQAGASLQTAAPTGTNGGGYVMLLGGNVTNAGLISTPQGQTVLAAGAAFTLRQGGGPISTTLGSEVSSSNTPINIFSGLPSNTAYQSVFFTGSVTNSGIVMADRGDITFVGHALTQAGALLATTTVDTRGTIHFLTPTDGTDPTASITLAPGSVTEILPEDLGQTALDSQRAANIAASLTANALRANPQTASPTNPQLNNQDFLADQLGESRVELSTGGSVDVGVGASVLAQGGQIAVGGGSRVLVENGASLDVSGTTNALLPSAAYDLLVNVQPFQARDSAANRTGPLKGANVFVDPRTLLEIASGAYAGNIYTGGGLLEVGGYLGLVPHHIGEWTAIGGQVTLQASQLLLDPVTAQLSTVAGQVITQPGAVINLQGGTVTYQAGPVQQTYVQAADGQVFNINAAPGNLVYTGLYTGTVISHPRWKVTDYYVNPLLTPGAIMEPGYIVGRDAGTLTVNAGSASLEGAVFAGVSLGQYQTGPRPAAVTDPYLLAQSVVPQAGALQFGNYLAGVLQPTALDTNVVFQSGQGAPLPALPPIGPSSTGSSSTGSSTTGTPMAIPAGIAIFDAPQLDADGFATLAVSTSGNIEVNAALQVADGGSVSLTGAFTTIHAGITARAGGITVTDQLASGQVAFSSGITLAQGAVLDARGVWTNAALDPAHVAGLGHVNGGTVTIADVRGVTLTAGSRIDVSSGGAFLAGGKQLAGRGGSISVTADTALLPIIGGRHLDPVSFDSTFAGYASGGGGTLSLTAPELQIGGSLPAPFITVVLNTQLFDTGFAKYVVDGTAALAVLPGTQITAVQPAYILNQGSALPSGRDPADAYSLVLPPLYSPAKGSDVLTERAGASISLVSSVGTGAPLPSQGGSLTIGLGAAVSVDPGQSITLAGYGQVSVFGTLTAHGGTIHVTNTSFDTDQPTPSGNLPASDFIAGTSVWLGPSSVVDVSGQAVIQVDAAGHRFGLAQSGGTITLGSAGAATPAPVQVIQRPGSVLDADGAQATVDIVPGAQFGTALTPTAPVTLVGNGGSISAASIDGIALDGVLTARAGGPGAAGGQLALTLDATNLAAFNNIPTYVYQPRQILITQGPAQGQPDPMLAPGMPAPAATYGVARLSQQQIDAGGFDAVSLSAQGAAIVFEGNVSLHAARSITLASGIIGASTPYETIGVAAPYVDLVGEISTLSTQPAPTGVPSFGTLTVQADLIDQSDAVFLGGSAGISPATPAVPPMPGMAPSPFGPPIDAVYTSAFGFGQTILDSTGDLRLLGTADKTLRQSTLLSIGNITLRAAQIYPVSNRIATILAGYAPGHSQDQPASQNGTILVQATSGSDGAQLPYSVGGSLTLEAGTIVQGGVIRAPEGNLTFTDGSVSAAVAYPSHVTFSPASITSVSLAGQTIPFGGTVDGVSYTTPGGAILPAQPAITVQSQAVEVDIGATIDLRGGGTLSGAGFVFGRGGSADVLTTPLLDITGGAAVANAQAQVAAIQPVHTGDPVYAILPGYAAGYAPATGAGDAGYSTPAIGQQITVGGEVAGLAAGTYTLLPAYYALLPGGFRVELTSGAVPVSTTFAQGNFTTAAPVTLGTANTSISSPVPTAALLTSGAGVRQLSQYNEESYNSFEASSATAFGAPRPFLPEDAKTLTLVYPAVIGTLTALNFAPSALLKTSAPGGYGATLQIDTTSTLAIIGPNDPIATNLEVAIQAGTLDALDMPRLVLGGTLTLSTNSPQVINVNADAARVDIRQHAVLTAGDILVTATDSGAITVFPGGTLSTIGAGPAAFDTASSGYYFSADNGTVSFPVLDVSNGRVSLTPDLTAATAAAISVGNGSALLAGGSLNLAAPLNTVVSIGQAELGAAYASIAVAALNVGSQPALSADAAMLPAGLSLTPQSFASLLNGNPAQGVPAASALTLTATQEVNLLGSVALDSGTTALVLNTPAIYGVGSATDVAAITAPRFTWNGITTLAALSGSQTGIAASALPGGQIAAALAGEISGQLSINAGTIVLGYGPQTQPNPQLQLDRLISGFSTVTLTGTSEITANNTSALAVYAQNPTFGAPGIGGDLSLVSPLVSTDPAAVLKLTAGGVLSLTAPRGASPAATAAVTSLGGEIDLAASAVEIATAVALPAGRLTATAQNGIDLAPSGTIDLAGRAVHLLDQTVFAPGGTLAFESTAGSITLDTGARIDVSSPGAAAGRLSFSALAGEADLSATLLGGAISGQTGGSLTVIAGTLATTAQATNVAAGGSAFDSINAGLNAGGFTADRSFEFGTDIGPSGAASTSLVIGNDMAGHTLLAAHAVSVTADLGGIEVTGTIDASGTGPGSIMLAALQNLAIETTAKLDAHASTTAEDSNGQPIDAENRAHVTLTTTAGTLTLAGGSVDLSTPSGDTPQGQLVLNAPRTGQADMQDDVAINAAAPFTVLGAQSIALYAWRSYAPTDPNGTISQTPAQRPHPAGTQIVTLNAINADNIAFMTAAGGNAALAGRLAGLASYGATFHLRPGVEIDSTTKSNNNLTIAGDLFLGNVRYSDVGYGTAAMPGVVGSGEPGALLFRAKGDLIVNGSVTDGFAAPLDVQAKNWIPADAGWVYISPSANGGLPDPLGADILLPSTVSVTIQGNPLTTSAVALGAGTTFDPTRAISLNYGITIQSTPVNANTVIPFSAALASGSPVTIPQGGFVTTAQITEPGGTVIPAGSYLAGGTVIPGLSVFAAASVFPVVVTVDNNTLVPAGTLLSIFNSTLALSAQTAILPANAFIPSNTVPLFVTQNGAPIDSLELRPVNTDALGNPFQAPLYALGALLPAGSLSWNLDFVAGANAASANVNAVLPRSVLNGGALAAVANTAFEAPGSLILDDQHAFTPSANAAIVAPAFSVIRTGTGDLTLEAGGNFDQSSLYGIYTAGTQDSSAPVGGAYDAGRASYAGGRQVIPGPAAVVGALNRIIDGSYRANYPTDGGDLVLFAQGSVTGDLYGGSTSPTADLLPSDEVGSWLWRQGSAQLGQPTAWWINFGSLAVPYGSGDTAYYQNALTAQLVGFQGIGALGGGNVVVSAGQDAGQITDRTGVSFATVSQTRGEGLVIAVGGTGRVISSNGTQSTLETGGGSLTLRIGGTLNPVDALAYATIGDTSILTNTVLNGSLIDLRGNITVAAGAIGRVDATYSNTASANDPRPVSPYTATFLPVGGIDLVPGDGTVAIATARDLVINGAGDAGRETEQSLTHVANSSGGTPSTLGVASGFTLWTAETAISLFSAGGNVDPVNAATINGASILNNAAATDGRILYPSQLYVTAATGDIVYGAAGAPNPISLETAPSANEQVAFLAGTSILANGLAIDLSGADPQGQSTPLNPAWSAFQTTLTNLLPGLGTVQNTTALFALEADTPTVPYLSAHAQATPALFYAANGDIVNFITGETLTFNSNANETLPQWYLAAKSVRIMASEDIVSSGTRPSAPPGALQQNQQSSGFSAPYTASGNLFLNPTQQSISVVSAGRDILSGYFYVGGQGLLEVDAGRNIQQVGYVAPDGTTQQLAYGSIKSLGSLQTGAPISLTGGAGISVNAGIGAGADYTAFADLYLNPANQANLALQITDPANTGKVQAVYASQLLSWLQQNYGYTGTQAGALAYFLDPANVPVVSQDAFLRGIFYAELLASGQQYNDPNSRFHLSYLRGRQAIDALLPGQNGSTTSNGVPAGYSGALTMASGSVIAVPGTLFDAGVATERGGDIQVLAPGGQLVLGTSGGAAPGGGTGLVTNGAGNIDVFSLGSDLLGKSRIFTNAGGNIQIWSAAGDINAGIGARTTIVFNPPVISFDNTGGIVETPAVPSSGAGIATEQPFPSIPAGNIDLTAPLGTIDAGEAGVRSSGNLNLAAARLANTSGFSAGGKTSGNSGAATVSLGAVEAAGAAAGAGQQAAQNLSGTHTQDQVASIIEVDVLSVSGESEEQKRKRK